jgi:hypothetical protein
MNYRITRKKPLNTFRGMGNISINALSPIQTILSVPELHRINPCKGLADYTAGQEFHPALKVRCLFSDNIITYRLLKIKLYFNNALGCTILTGMQSSGCFIHLSLSMKSVFGSHLHPAPLRLQCRLPGQHPWDALQIYPIIGRYEPDHPDVPQYLQIHQSQ